MRRGGMAVENRKIYEDITQRTNGDIYIGVVGTGHGMSCPKAVPDGLS